MPKNCVRFFTKGAPCRQSTQSLLISSRVSLASPIVPRSSTCGPTRIAKPIHAYSHAHCAAAQNPFRIGPRSSSVVAAIIIDKSGEQDSEGVAAWLRHAGASSADVLTGGHLAWAKAGGPLIPVAKVPRRDALGRTIWVTRSRPKVDRIACPWLIHRFVDPSAVFLFVAPAEVSAVAERFGGAAFDIEGAFWSHRGERCTFDTMLEEWGLAIEPLQRLAVIVRGADTARLDLAPEAAGLLAASLGQSRMYADDLEQLKAGMALYDAFYRWCRDATDEPHNWPATKSGKAS